MKDFFSLNLESFLRFSYYLLSYYYRLETATNFKVKTYNIVGTHFLSRTQTTVNALDEITQVVVIVIGVGIANE